MPKVLVRSSLLAAALATALAAPAAAADEPRCSERQFSATGTPGRIHFTGRRNARLAWSAAVRAELGQAYATWDRAVSRRFKCAFSEWRYHCSATARPCRSFVAGR